MGTIKIRSRRSKEWWIGEGSGREKEKEEDEEEQNEDGKMGRRRKRLRREYEEKLKDSINTVKTKITVTVTKERNIKTRDWSEPKCSFQINCYCQPWALSHLCYYTITLRILCHVRWTIMNTHLQWTRRAGFAWKRCDATQNLPPECTNGWTDGRVTS